MNSIIPEKLEMLKKIYLDTMADLDPAVSVERSLNRDGDGIRIMDRAYDFSQLYLGGFGKASTTMARGAVKALGNRIHRGLVITKHHHREEIEGIDVLEGGHPVPDKDSITATGRLLELVDEAGPGDLVLMLISGGGSALLESPREGISLEDLQKVTSLLLRCGAHIGEMNTIRRHLSQVKGGGLARRISPARCVSLILSDVMGSDISSIASGPTSQDPTTFGRCMEILEKYRLRDQVPLPVLKLIEDGINGDQPETLKVGDPALSLCENIILADNAIACRTLSDSAKRQGIEKVYIDRPATEPVEDYVRHLRGLVEEYSKGSSPTLLIAGGELTVKIPDSADGLGGRNQHLSLLFTRDVIRDFPGLTALFASTDGTDGPTDAGGAFAHRGIDSPGIDEAIARFDSYNYLKENGGLLVTGPTGNNLNDLFMILL